MSKSDAYAKVVEHATLENVLLTSSTFEVSPKFFDLDDGADRFLSQHIEGKEYDEESKLLIGTVHCRVWIDTPEGDAQNKDKKLELLTIEATYLVAFKLTGGHEMAQIFSFFDRLAPLSCWPYFRVHVARVAAEANVELPVLPIKKLVHPIRATSGYVDPDKIPQRREMPKPSKSEK